jgi:hypothetical protein
MTFSPNLYAWSIPLKEEDGRIFKTCVIALMFTNFMGEKRNTIW